MTPAPISVERLRELLAKATPGPWIAWENSFSRWQILGGRGVLAGIATPNDPASPPDSWGECEVNAALIAEAITVLPALLHQLAERDAEVERLRDAMRDADAAFLAMLERAEADERAKEEAQRDAQRWEMLCSILDAGSEAMFLPGLSDTERALETGGELEGFVDGNIEQCAAFLAASGGKVDG